MKKDKLCALAPIANSATVWIHLGYWELPLILGGLATPFLRRRIAISYYQLILDC